jgi:hypothetical protein
VRLLLTAGQASDKTAAPELLAGLSPTDVVADRGYDSRALIELVAAAGGSAYIPTQSRVWVQRSVPPALYRRRKPRRAVLLQAQTVPARRHPLRQVGPQLPRRRRPRLSAALAQGR